jgi:dTMP kinase
MREKAINTGFYAMLECMKSGKLIVIEGTDGSGKETQAKLLLENLKNKGLSVASLAFPQYKNTVGGKLLALSLGKNENFVPDFSFSTLDPESASLLYAMDRVESKKTVQDLLKNNDVVVLDRYFTANLLHQGAKFEDETERNKFIENFNTIELEILKIPKPALVLYLQIPYEVSMKRINERSESGVQKKDLVETDLEYVKRSNEKGVSIAKYCGWEVVDGYLEGRELSREEISTEVLEKVKSILSVKNENMENKKTLR